MITTAAIARQERLLQRLVDVEARNGSNAIAP
jgi:hypothetical protein